MPVATVQTTLGRWAFEERRIAGSTGDGAVVLLHGLLYDRGMWAAQMEPLAAVGRVVAFDGPGHGESDAPPPFGLAEQAQALDGALEALGIGRAVLVGHSWGGMVAMELALRRRTRVRALALVDTSGEPEPFVRRLKYRIFIGLYRRFGFPSWLVGSQVWPLIFSPAARREHPEWLDWLGQSLARPCEGRARAAEVVLVRRLSLLDRLPELQVPALVVCGRLDRSTPPRRSEALARAIAGARLAWIEGCGHMSPMERPGELNALVVPFAREHLAAR